MEFCPAVTIANDVTQEPKLELLLPRRPIGACTCFTMRATRKMFQESPDHLSFAMFLHLRKCLVGAFMAQ